MPGTSRINNYINHFLYSMSNPRMAEVIASSVSVDDLKEADANTKLMSLGSLFTSENLEQCIQLADQIDFKDITYEDSLLLVRVLFSKFYEHGFVDQRRADALKHLLAAICPKALTAHEQVNEPPLPAKPIKLDYSAKVSPSVRGAIFIGEYIFGPNSRKSEIGYRIKKALSSQGWSVATFPVTDVRQYFSLSKNDFALIDVFAFHNMTIDDACGVLASLRRSFRKIVLFDSDVWAGRFNSMLRAVSSHIDYIWGFTADWCLIDEPGFDGKSILFPNFGGLDFPEGLIENDLAWNTCAFNFTGSVQIYNLNRISWLLGFIHHNLPVAIRITDPEVDDGLDTAHSQLLYAREITSTHAAINLTTRTDGSRIVTGRSLEVISLNRLLVQEFCPVFNRYFVEGEHFLEFLDINELATIVEFLRSHPDTARTICSRGHGYYKENYSCEKLVQHFQTLL